MKLDTWLANSLCKVLIKSVAELKDTENPQPTYITKNEKAHSGEKSKVVTN